MRAELFVKDTAALLAQARLLYSFGAVGINLPNKAKQDAPLAALEAVAGVLDGEQLSQLCPHFSLKFNADRSPETTLKRFEAFCEGAAALNVRRCLLVSGSGSRSFDTVECLRGLRLPAERCPRIGVAFNPFFPDRAAREKERARLRLKLGTGRVSSVWLQIGSDPALLAEGLAFLTTLTAERQLDLEFFGSVFVPSKKLLAQMKFRPWSGVFLSEEFLGSVEQAEAITASVLRLYRAYGVEVLLETAMRTRDEWEHAQRLMANADEAQLPGVDPLPTAAAAAAAADDARASLPPPKRPRQATTASLSEYVGCLPVVPTVPAVPPTAAVCAAGDGAAPRRTPSAVAVCWYRAHDLRIADHPALQAASTSAAVVPAFVWPMRRGEWALGGAAQAWLRCALGSMQADLSEHYHSRLVLRVAQPAELAEGEAGAAASDGVADEAAAAAAAAVAVASASDVGGAVDVGVIPLDAAAHLEAVDTAAELLRLVRECRADAVHWSRSYEPEGRLIDAVVARALEQAGVAARAHAGALLYEPASIRLPGGFSGGHWGTLMPFVKACERSGPAPERPLPPPQHLRSPPSWPLSEQLATMRLAAPPTHRDGSSGEDWGTSIITTGKWVVSEAEAHRTMLNFVEGAGLRGYESRRSRADEPGTVSRLSPYLRFGQLSPRHVFHAVKGMRLEREVTKTFARRLHWRDLASFQLHSFPDMGSFPIRRHYVDHAWSEDRGALRAWKRGMTGFPMVDAGMRCLYATGWMHQSVRMVVASFLVEYLGISWVEGVRWFHHTLVDADVAINSMMWQNAGRSGIDQWNFVLSPTTGSQDPSGAFCRRWLPELARLPTKYLHEPWKAPPNVLASAGVELGHSYPERVLSDLDAARRGTVAALLAARAANLEFNDAGGYDLIRLPGGELTRVFTKQEFRLTGAGQPKPPPAGAVGARGGRHRGGGGGRSSSRGGGRGGGGRSRPASDAQQITAYFRSPGGREAEGSE